MRDVIDDVRERLALRWLRFALPREYFADPSQAALSAPMRNLLREHGFAECHLHLGGALRFDLAWSDLCASAARPRRLTASDPGVPFGTPERFLCAVTCAASADSVIDLAARWEATASSLAAVFERLERSARRLGIATASLEIIWMAVMALERGNLGEIDRVGAARALADLHRLRERMGYPALPPASSVLAAVAPDSPFATAALQTERVRVMFYRYLVQRPLTRGLQHFFRHFGRLRTVARERMNLVREAMTLSGAGRGLRSLEIRIAPEDELGAQRSAWTRLAAAIDAAEADFPGEGDRVSVHVVVHFVRNRGGGQRSGAPAVAGVDTLADPRHDLAGWRYARFYEQIARQQLTLRSLFETSASARTRIRALDLCTDESGIPTWTYAPVVTALRSDRRLRSLGVGLRMTVHCGEDFVDLLTGLRRIWEAVHYLELREGDRLGHALALGIDVAQWSTSVVARRVEERMWDLVWAWSLLRRTEKVGQLHAIAAEAERLGYRIFGDPLTIHDLHALYKDLHDEDMLRAVGYPRRERPAPEDDLDGRRLLLRYLRSPEVYLRGQQIKLFETAHDRDLIESCQQTLRQVVSKTGLSVEANVSSNLLIGNLLQTRAHPLWRFRSPDGKGPHDIGIVLGSDDPATFATTLPEEYQLAYDLLVNDGIAPVEALAWVNQVRHHGLMSRF